MTIKCKIYFFFFLMKTIKDHTRSVNSRKDCTELAKMTYFDRLSMNGPGCIAGRVKVLRKYHI
jgi:hypothetical protein